MNPILNIFSYTEKNNTEDDGKTSLRSLPPDLIELIFCMLETNSDVAQLNATCKACRLSSADKAYVTKERYQRSDRPITWNELKECERLIGNKNTEKSQPLLTN